MSKKNSQNRAKHNARLAWLSQNMGKGLTDMNLILGLMAAFPPVSEKTAREELKEIYQRYWDINVQYLPEQKVKFLELGFEMLEEMRNAMQLGPAANHFKTLAGIAGVTTERSQVDQKVTQGAPAPKADTVRDRISKLMKDSKVRERAQRAGLDLKLEDDDEG